MYTASDLNLYYDLDHPLWHKCPDWFLVVGVSQLYEGAGKIAGEGDRASYVIWQEKVSPSIVVELLSPGTESDDLGPFAPKKLRVAPKLNTPPSKFMVYEQILKVPHYIVYNKRTRNLRYFCLVDGVYQEQKVAATNPRLWIADLKIGLAVWHGTFEGMPKAWLRWCDANGTLLLTDTEAALQREAVALQEKLVAQERQQQAEAQWQRAEAQRRQAEAQCQRAEVEREQAELQMRRTVLTLHEMGLAIAQISQITGLTEAKVLAIVAPEGT